MAPVSAVDAGLACSMTDFRLTRANVATAHLSRPDHLNSCDLPSFHQLAANLQRQTLQIFEHHNSVATARLLNTSQVATALPRQPVLERLDRHVVRLIRM
jgi:hypothetical protein